MTRARWLGVIHHRPNAIPRAQYRRGAILSMVGDILVAVAVVAAIAYLAPMIFLAAADDIRRDQAMQGTKLGDGCATPTEHEQLHVVIVRQGERLVPSCTYVGPRGAYRRTPHGAPEVRP